MLSPALVPVLNSFEVCLLASAQPAFSAVLCEISNTHYGCSDGSFEDAAESPRPGNWPVAAADYHAYLDAVALMVARERKLLPHPGYNGVLARLENWEVGADGALKLSCTRTNYLTLLTASAEVLYAHPRLRDLCLDRMLDDPAGAVSTNVVNVHLLVTSSDGYLVLARRGRGMEDNPGLLAGSAGGVVECAADSTSANLYAQALRELREEIGSDTGVQHVRPLALLLSAWPSNVGVWLLLSADSALTFAELVAGHKSEQTGPTTAWETEGLVGLPTANRPAALHWLAAHRREFAASAAVDVLLTLSLGCETQAAAAFAAPDLAMAAQVERTLLT